MSKMPLEWHKKNLFCMMSNLENYQKDFDRMKQKLDRLNMNILILKDQIKEAEKRKKDGFDADKFLKIMPIRGE
jgi:arginine deiminase